jgi:hypothetical protein
MHLFSTSSSLLVLHFCSFIVIFILGLIRTHDNIFVLFKRVLKRTKIWSWVLMGPETKIDCAGEGPVTVSCDAMQCNAGFVHLLRFVRDPVEYVAFSLSPEDGSRSTF